MALIVGIPVLAASGCFAQHGMEQQANLQHTFQDWAVWHCIVLGGLAFWGYLLVWFLCLVLAAGDFGHRSDERYDLNYYFTDRTNWGPSGLVFIIGALILWAFGDFNPFLLVWGFIKAHYGFVIIGIVAYIPISLVWVTYKVKTCSSDWSQGFEIAKEEFFRDAKRQGGKDEITIEKEWNDHCDENGLLAPRMAKFKNRAIFWMAWWPFSMANAFIADFIFRLFETIYEFCEGYFQRVLMSSLKKHIVEMEASKKKIAEYEAAKAAGIKNPPPNDRPRAIG